MIDEVLVEAFAAQRQLVVVVSALMLAVTELEFIVGRRLHQRSTNAAIVDPGAAGFSYDLV